MKNMHYPREKRGMLFTKRSQLVINPNFSPMTMKSMYHLISPLLHIRQCMNIWTRTILKLACNCLGLQTKLTSASNIFTYQ